MLWHFFASPTGLQAWHDGGCTFAEASFALAYKMGSSRRGDLLWKAWIPTITSDAEAWWRILFMHIYWTVSKQTCIMDRSRVAHKDTTKHPSAVKDGLHLDKWKQFSVDTVLTMRTRGESSPSINGTHTLLESCTGWQMFKALTNSGQIICIWKCEKLSYCGEQPVANTMLYYLWAVLWGISKVLDTTLINCPCAHGCPLADNAPYSQRIEEGALHDWGQSW